MIEAVSDANADNDIDEIEDDSPVPTPVSNINNSGKIRVKTF